MKENKIIRYNDLSFACKIAFIGGWVGIVINGIAVLVGFINGLLTL